MTYHKQFSKCSLCAPGLNAEHCSWLYGWMQHDGGHSYRFALRNDCYFYYLYVITEWNFLVSFIFSLDCVLSLIRESQDDIVLISCQSTWFGVWTVHIARMTLAHAQTDYHFLQYSQWDQKDSFTYRNRYANYFLQRSVSNNHILCRLCTHDLRPNTICSPESISCMVRRYDGHMQG